MREKDLKRQQEETEDLTDEIRSAKAEDKKVDVEAIKRIVETEEQDTQPNYISLGLCIGLCLGGCLGIVLNNLSLGMGLGMCAGVAIGVAAAYKNTKADEEDEKETSKEGKE